MRSRLGWNLRQALPRSVGNTLPRNRYTLVEIQEKYGALSVAADSPLSDPESKTSGGW